MRTKVPAVRLSVLIFILFVFSFQSKAQSVYVANGRVELGIGIGPSFFLGDLGGAKGKGKTFVKDVDFPLTKLCKGIYMNFYPTEWLGFRLAANLGELEGDDAETNNKGGDERFRYYRNLKFKSSLSEAYAALEVYPTVFFEEYEGLEHKLRPYGVLGGGVFHFNPKGEYVDASGNKKWVELKPLRTEGQGMSEYPDRKPYSLTQLETTMGGGFKYYLSESMYVGFEILHRKTYTDYVDDVSTKYIDPRYFDMYLDPEHAAEARQLFNRQDFSIPTNTRRYIGTQRGDPKENDAFFSSILRCGWRLNGANSPNGRAKRQLKCPVFY